MKRRSIARKLNGVRSYLNAPKADFNRDVIIGPETRNIRRTLLNNKRDKYNLR